MMINYLGLRNEVQVEVDGLLVAQLATQCLNFAFRGFDRVQGHTSLPLALLNAAFEIHSDLMDVLSWLTALACGLLALLERVNNGDGRWSEIHAELERNCDYHAAVSCGDFVAARETESGGVVWVF